MQKTIEILGVPVTVRAPSEPEAIALEDKRSRALYLDSQPPRPNEPPRNHLDDGDEEVLGCVVSPSKQEVLALLEWAPKAAERLEDALREISGWPVELDPAPVAVGVPDEPAESLLAFRVGSPLLAPGEPDKRLGVVLRRIGRVEYKLLRRELRAGKSQILSARRVASLGRDHVVSPAAVDWAASPWLALALGTALLSAASGVEAREAGK